MACDPATAAPPGMYLDQESGLALPDGTMLAPVGRRIGAWFLAIPLAIVTLGIGYIIWGLIIWGNGQTPALQVLGMRCWRPETNRVPGFWYMALREIVGRFVEGILGIFTEAASFIMMCTGRERKAIHDWIAGPGRAARPGQGPRPLTMPRLQPETPDEQPGHRGPPAEAGAQPRQPAAPGELISA